MAHPYVDKEYLESKRPKKRLIKLFADKENASDPEPTEIDIEILDPILLKSSQEVDGYLRRRYSVPLSEVPDILKEKVMSLVIYYGEDRREAITERARKSYEDAIAWLKDCSRGLVDLGLEPPPTGNTTRQISFSTTARKFTDDSLGNL